MLDERLTDALTGVDATTKVQRDVAQPEHIIVATWSRCGTLLCRHVGKGELTSSARYVPSQVLRARYRILT